jgi:hypothetical protein
MRRMTPAVPVASRQQDAASERAAEDAHALVQCEEPVFTRFGCILPNYTAVPALRRQ